MGQKGGTEEVGIKGEDPLVPGLPTAVPCALAHCPPQQRALGSPSKIQFFPRVLSCLAFSYLMLQNKL